MLPISDIRFELFDSLDDFTYGPLSNVVQNTADAESEARRLFGE